MDFDKLVKKRKSVRKFRNWQVSFRDVLDAIDSANMGPFAGNNNHLRYLIVESRSRIAKIAEHCDQDFVETAQVVVLVCSDDSKLEDLYGTRGRIYSRQQAGAAIYSLMLALSEIGIGSCWVGAYSDSALRREFDIPKEIQIEAVVPIGFSNDGAKKVKKKSLERSLYWEVWGKTRRPSALEVSDDDYDAPKN